MAGDEVATHDEERRAGSEDRRQANSQVDNRVAIDRALELKFECGDLARP